NDDPQENAVPVAAPSAPAAKKAPPPAAALPPAKPGDKPGEAKKELSPEERAARGVVILERAGQPLALGVVLQGDGRILSALSPLGSGNDVEARYADGTSVHVKLGHHDRTWDLALLVPQSGKWSEGLVASSREPVRQDATIHAFTLNKNKVSASP